MRSSNIKSVVLNDSGDFTESWLEFNRSSKDQKSFFSFVQNVEHKINLEGTLLSPLPKEFRKKIETAVHDALLSISKAENITSCLTHESFSLLYVFVYSISKDPSKEKKINKKKDLVKIIKSLLLKLDEILIEDHIESHTFKSFEYLLIVILEIVNENSDEKVRESICNCICSLLDKAFNNFHLIYYDLFAASDIGTVSTSILNTIIEKDIVYLALRCLNKTFPHPKCKSTGIIITIFKYISIIIERPGFSIHTYYMIVEKTLVSLEILTKIRDKKEKFILSVANELELYFPQIFQCICVRFLEFNCDEPCENFLKDVKPIGRLFSLVLEVFSRQMSLESNKSHAEIFERLPIQMFSSVLLIISAQNLFSVQLPNTLQLQAYFLQFLVEYFKAYWKKILEERKQNSMKNSGIISLLLRKEIFIVEDGDNKLLGLATLTKKNWRTLWVYLSINKCNIKPMLEAIIQSTIDNYNDYSYIARITKWISEIDVDMPQFTKDILKEGLISNLLAAIKGLFSTNLDLTTNGLILKLLEHLFCLKPLKEMESGNYIQVLDDKNMLHSERNREMCLILIRRILVLDSPKSHVSFKELIKKTGSGEFLLRLLEILMETTEKSEQCAKSFLHYGILFVLRSKINPETIKSEEFTVQLWEIVIKIVRVLLLSPVLSSKNLEDIDFNCLAEYLSNKCNRNFSDEISTRCIQDVECILYGSTDITSSNKITIPQAIPLIFQVLTSSTEDSRLSEARLRITHQLRTEIGISYLAYYNAFDIILKYFITTTDLIVSEFFEAIVAKIIPFHIPPQALAKLLTVVKSSTNPKKRLVLLQALEQAISNSKCPENMLTPTHYFYFLPRTYLEFQSDTGSCSSVNQVSVLFWIQPCEVNECCLFQMICHKSVQISMLIKNRRVQVTVGNSILTSSHEIKNENWTFVGLSIRSKKSALRNKTMVSLCLNESFEDLDFGENVKFDGKIFTNLVCGNNFEKTLGFIGKMSAIYVVYKGFGEAEFLTFLKLSQQNNLHFSINNLKSEDSKIFKDLRKTLIFEWHPNLKDPSWPIKYHFTDTSKRFNGVNIFDSIKLNGGLKIFLPLINIENQINDEILVVTSIFLRIIICTQSSEILTQEFILYTGYVLNSLNLFSKLTTNLINIVTSLKSKELRGRLLKLLLLNESIDNIPPNEKASHLNALLFFIRNLFVCDRENMYVIYNHIKNLGIGDIEKAFEIMIPERTDEYNKDAVCLILVQMLKDKSYNAIEAILNVISKRFEILAMDKYLQGGLFYLMVNLEPSFQIKIIKLFFKDIDIKKSKSAAEIEGYRRLILWVSECLSERHIDQTIVMQIFEIYSTEGLPDSLKIGLLEIITKGIKYSESEDDMNFYLCLIRDHQQDLIKLIHECSDFPDWIITTVTNNSQSAILLSVCHSIFAFSESTQKLCKLKVFIKYLKNHEDFKISLLHSLCGHFISMNTFLRPENYLEFLSIVELVQIGGSDEAYSQIIEKLKNYGLEHSLLTPSQSVLDLSFNKLKNAIKDHKDTSALKIFIRLVFRGINSNLQSQCMQILQDFWQNKSRYLGLSKTDTRKLNQCDLIDIEIFTNLCEVYYNRENNFPIASFISFPQILPKLLLFIDSQMESDLKKNYDDREGILKYSHSILYSNLSRINTSLSLESDTSRRSMSGDSTSVKEVLKKMISSDIDFPQCLYRPEWIQNVHLFLYSYFIYQKKLDYPELRTESVSTKKITPVYQDFVSKYECDWISNFKETRALYKLHITKKYKAYLHLLTRLKAVQDSNDWNFFKVRPYFDERNRYSLTSPCNNSRRDLMITRSPDKIFLRSFSMAYFESIIEKSGELCSSPIQENQPEMSDSETDSVEEEIEAVVDSISSSLIIECERITIKGSYFGNLEINTTHLVYNSEGKAKPEGKYVFSALDFTQLRKECKRIWENSEISEIICRRFLHQHTALEIYLKSGKSYYFNVFTPENREEVFNSLKKWKNLRIITAITPKIVNAYTDQWIEGKLDNFAYLLVLNKLASRSFHDLSQYPVFPWVIKDFTSEKLDLDDPKIYRNLEWPIGAQEESLRQDILTKYMQFQEDGITPFNYGSHYSCGGVVVHYLVRIEPYSTQARMLQNNCFDVADRLFISMENAWTSCNSRNGDVKEMIPELFSFPEVLINVNHNDFGKRQDGRPVDNFEPPKWASNAWDFIRKHRKCLESPFVTESLHHWIDLIFGYQQTGREAVDKLNIFFSVSYEEDFARALKENIDEATLRGMIEQAYHFGQTPVRLFSRQHPQHRQKRQDRAQKQSIFEKFFTKPKLSEEEKKFKQDRATCNKGFSDQEVKHSIKREEIGRIFALLPTPTHLLAVKWDTAISKYFILRFKWENHIEFGLKYKISELEGFSIFNTDKWLEYQSWKSTLPKIDIKMILDIGQYQFCVWQDKYLVSAFHSDNTIKLNTQKGELKRSIKYHCGLVTCVNSTSSLLFSGSLDSAVIAWTGDDLDLYNIYLGHSSSIRQIVASDSYQIVLSLSASGTILMHDMRSAECLRKLAEPDVRPARVMAFSEMGVIAVAFMDKEYTGIFSINGMKWDDSRPGAEDVWCMTFNKTGEYLVTGSNKSIAFFDIFDKGNGLENLMYQSVENTVLAIAISKDEEYLVFAINKENKSAISLLKVQSKLESQQTRKIMERFT